MSETIGHLIGGGRDKGLDAEKPSGCRFLHAIRDEDVLGDVVLEIASNRRCFLGARYKRTAAALARRGVQHDICCRFLLFDSAERRETNYAGTAMRAVS